MSKTYAVRRKLREEAGSIVVTLPKLWVENHQLREGRTVRIEFNSFKGLHIIPEEV
ncbi:MAG TPA: hypothetical protein VF906_04180 [Candidatus Bathyarchaeia archaeon]